VLALPTTLDVFVQVWYSGNIQPEQMPAKDNAVDDYLLQFNRYSSAETAEE
jgi:hypothetical protein